MLGYLIFALFQAPYLCVFADVKEYDSVFVSMHVDRIHRRVSDHFLSVAIDASLVAEEKYMYLLSSPKLRTLAKALSPAFLRFGGTKQDFMIFAPENDLLKPRDFPNTSPFHEEDICARLELPPLLEDRLKREWAKQEVLLQKEEMEGVIKRVKFSEYAVDLLYTFANCSGLELIFGLNALLRTHGNVWDSRNAEKLLSYCESKQYNMSWELGNEPNSYEKKAGFRVDGYQLGQDFVHLRTILQESKLYQMAKLYGPDIGQPRDHRRDLLEGFLKSGAKAIDACTWHHYYVNGRDTSLEDFLDPEVLDTLATKTNEVLQTTEQVSPGMKVWLGETSSAYGGGALGLSDTFVAGFMWLDKLGLAAKLGLDVIIRQVLLGSGTYHLVDSNLDPLPDYWLSVLYKRLVGPEVLNAEAFAPHGAKKRRLRTYLHCTNKRAPNARRGAVTLFALNLSGSPARLSLPPHLSNSSVVAFVLEAGETGYQGLYSRSVQLNGEVLKLVDDRTLPSLQGAPLPPRDHLKLPSFSFTFYVLKDANAQACR
ncbi:hypothetical protein COCON_G00166380 [Conger conger]|uniref:Heparanase n=1 Tax=Conger conger TaxID=82655 RepID=A0A9Q1HTQ0_CONCO|nr:heparanase [Conger conger]KAJ8260915.1 hypothetical protein COCON_G00166380 [Conger conger]